MSLRRTLRRWRIAAGRDGGTVLRLHHGLEGQLAMEEVRFLYRAATGRRTIVEIGSFRGKSCVTLALGSADIGGHVTAIDPHLALDPGGRTAYAEEDLRVFERAVERWGVSDRVTHIVERSEDARPAWGDRPIDLLWIDGDHSYPGVRRDLDDWRSLVSPGGMIACHDCTHRESVRRAWAETVAREGAHWEIGRPVRSICWARRRSTAG